MEQFLIDTNCISDYLSELLPTSGMNFMDLIIDRIPNISVITQIEVLCWNTKDPDTINKIKNLVKESTIFEISPDIVVQYVKIRKGKKIKIPDAIIATTAICNGYTLLTNNSIDFINIPNLKIVSPHKV